MRVRTLVGAALCAVLAAAGLVAAPGAGAASASPTSYVVLYEAGVSDAAGRAAVAAAGGTVRRSNAAVGWALAVSSAADFPLRAAASSVLVGAARDRVIGADPGARRASVEQPLRVARSANSAVTSSVTSSGTSSVTSSVTSSGTSSPGPTAAPAGEPLAARQWDMAQIGATTTGSYARQRGSRKVLVGVIDTGIDGSHPDLAPAFSRSLSRNFTTDMRDIDNGTDEDGDGLGDEPCEVTPSCVDPVDEDDNGHGTHVASTIAAALDGRGMAGVAPGVTLVSIRAGQDSGFFFLQPTLDALAYAADIGVDVVNMSFYVDPWLFTCDANPADTRVQQVEQQTIRHAVQRAVTYARGKGVLPVAATGNEGIDLSRPTSDGTSPDRGGPPHQRRITDACSSVPAETDGVVAVTATETGRGVAYYANYGLGEADVAAPGGDDSVGPGWPRGEVLGAYPERLARKDGSVDSHGVPTTSAVVRSCTAGHCAYYQYLQGTSMAAPHAAGVAALIVSQRGTADPAHAGGLTLAPATTERLLLASARPHACPTDGSGPGPCQGTAAHNGFYGAGIVDALRAVS